VFQNDNVGSFGVMALALLLIAFKGTSGPSGERASSINTILASYIEETAASIKIDITQYQLADVNSILAYSGGSNKLTRPSFLNTIQDNSLISRGTILTDIIDEFSDRGTDVITYEVQEGDTISFIASDFGVQVTTIISSNNLRDADEIKPGMILKIPPVDGIIHKVKKGDTIADLAQRYGVETDKIISFNSLPLAGDLELDDELIIPGGRIKSTGLAGIARSTAKRFAYLPSLSDFFAMPTLGFNWGRVHGRNGVDVANSCGTPVYASADGSVTLAKATGWNGGFGKVVRINHPNGTETVYAHLSGVLTSIGERVLKNQQIGVMGSTGRSTGCHLHFEVHGAKNPLAKY